MKINLEKGDYHMHSCFSDGLKTPEELVDRAIKLGLEEMALTDHDGVNGISHAVKRAEELKKDGRASIKVIAGIEFSTEIEAPNGDWMTELHILGYGFDTNDPGIAGKCQWMREKRIARNKKLIAALKSEGMDIDYEVLLAEKDKKGDRSFLGKPDIARDMVKKGYIKTKDQAFEEVFCRSPYREIKKDKLYSLDAVRTIKAAGGEAVLAHPGKIKGIGHRESESFWRNFEDILKRLVDAGLDGLECYYPVHSEIEKKRFLEFADEYGLFASKGSDYHGD